MTAAIMLAAGRGERFGGSKLRAPFRGRPLVCWAVDAAASAFADATIVVTGADDLADVLPEGLVVVENPRWHDGIATSLAAGIATAVALGHDAVVIGLADQPLVPASAWTAVGASDSPIAIASFDGRRRPPVRLDRSVWPLLPTEGDEGARGLMALRPDLVVAIPCSGEPADIDTREDLTRWS